MAQLASEFPECENSCKVTGSVSQVMPTLPTMMVWPNFGLTTSLLYCLPALPLNGKPRATTRQTLLITAG